jgi:DNA repair protein RadC
LASLDSVLSIHAVADVRGVPFWPEPSVARIGRSAGPLGVLAAADFADGDDKDAGEYREDQEILADLIAPVAFADALWISKDLLNRFGTLPQILAKIDDGINIPHLPQIVVNHLSAVKLTIARLLRRDICCQPILSTTKALLDYLHLEMAHLERESLRILFLDAANRLIKEKVMWQGTVSSVQCHPREILSAALQHKACAIIIAHNHPSGNPQPSPDDIRMTREICLAASHLDILVHDHIIISAGNHFSMRAEAIIDFTNFSKFTSQNNSGPSGAENMTGWQIVWQKMMTKIL